MSTPRWDLLEKTELRIERIGLEGANLTEVAAVVAGTLGLPPEDVLVIDARDDLIALDVLRSTVDPYAFAGRSEALLAALAAVAGVRVHQDTSVCAEGMLGWIVGDSADARAALDRSRAMAADLHDALTRRALVLSTGPEVVDRRIVDTNKPWIVARLEAAGFRATPGDDLPDDGARIAAAMREAVRERGFGLVVTTGGVGAEGKDATVEALLEVDPHAATPTIFTVTPGHGRHVKGGVRIGVGTMDGAFLVCLPGPHAEAAAGTAALVAALERDAGREEIAADIVAVLRARLAAGPGHGTPR